MTAVAKCHAAFIASGKTLALAESCTGGAVAASLVQIEDASKFLLGSIVAYSNDWKERFLGVPSTTLDQFGAVSRETAEAMIAGLFEKTQADVAAAVTGFAGKSVIYVAVAKRGEKVHTVLLDAPIDRKRAIDLSVQTTFTLLRELL